MARKISIGLIIILSFYIMRPFASALGMGAIFAVLFYPWMKRIEKGRFPNGLAAGLFTLAVTILLFLPVSTMVVAGVRSGLAELRQIKRMSPGTSSATQDEVLDNMFASTGVEKFLVQASKVAPIDPVQVSEQMKDALGVLAIRIGDSLSQFISSIPNMLIAFSVFLFSFYYFLADGLRFVYLFRQRSFFNEADTEKLIDTFTGLCRSVILASIISGGVQAGLAAVICLAVGIKQFPVIFLIVFIASFVPLIGSFPILISMAVYQLVNGNTVAGVVLAIGGIVIASVDHFIRPQVIRGSSNLHPLLAFVSALGGLEVLGISGVFMGPVIIGLFVAVLDVVRE